jgi:hypothetical protein
MRLKAKLSCISSSTRQEIRTLSLQARHTLCLACLVVRSFASLLLPEILGLKAWLVIVSNDQKIVRGAIRVREQPDRPPFDIQIGRCVVLEGPWGNPLVLLDTGKGLLKTDIDENVIGNLE